MKITRMERRELLSMLNQCNDAVAALRARFARHEPYGDVVGALVDCHLVTARDQLVNATGRLVTLPVVDPEQDPDQ